MQTGMTRSEVARRAGVGGETVRFYEQRGLLPPPERTAAGYRIYDDDAVARLRFVRRAQELGFTLDEIRELLDLRVDPDADRADVRERARTKIDEIEAKIAALERMRAALLGLVDTCHGHGPASDCPILDAIDAADGDDPATA